MFTKRKEFATYQVYYPFNIYSGHLGKPVLGAYVNETSTYSQHGKKYVLCPVIRSAENKLRVL